MFRAIQYLSLCSWITILCSVPAYGEIVLFGGQFTSGTGSLLGNLPPQRDFNVRLDFESLAPGIGRVNSGLLTFSSQTLNITDGNIFVSNSGTMDQATLLFNTSGPNGALSVSLFGDAITNNNVSGANLDALLRIGSPASITANFGTAGSYVGTVTAVPEPTSMALAGIGLFIVGAGRQWRKRMKTSK